MVDGTATRPPLMSTFALSAPVKATLVTKSPPAIEAVARSVTCMATTSPRYFSTTAALAVTDGVQAWAWTSRQPDGSINAIAKSSATNAWARNMVPSQSVVRAHNARWDIKGDGRVGDLDGRP